MKVIGQRLEVRGWWLEVALLVATWVMIGATMVATYRLGYVRGESAVLESEVAK